MKSKIISKMKGTTNNIRDLAELRKYLDEMPIMKNSIDSKIA